MVALVDQHAATVEVMTPAAAAAPESVFDLAFLGEPANRRARASWWREIELCRSAGWTVLADDQLDTLGSRLGAPLNASIVQITDPRFLMDRQLVTGSEQIVLRHVEAKLVPEVPEVAARLGRRLVLAPANPLERQEFAEHIPTRWLTVEDWPLLIAAERLFTARSRQPGAPFRVGVVGPGDGHHQPSRLRKTLAALGVPAKAVKIEELPADGPDDALLERLHLLLGPARCTCAEIPGLVLRALEAGVLPILSDAWKPHLRDAAVFWNWGQLPERLAEVVSDCRLWRQLLLGRLERANGRFGEEAYLDRLCRGVHGNTCPPRLPNSRALNEIVEHSRISTDLLIVGDFRRREEAVEQVLAQIAGHAAAGRSVMLFQAWNARPGPSIHPGIDACLRQGRARLLHPGEAVEAIAVQVIVPRLTIPALNAMRPAITGGQWHVVETEGELTDYDPADLHTTLERLYGVKPFWHAVQPAVQAGLCSRVPTASSLWPVQAMPDPSRRRRRRHVVGLVAYASVEAAQALRALENTTSMPNVDRQVLLCGNRRSLDISGLPLLQVLSIDGTDVGSFVAGLDLLIVPPVAKPDHLPRRAIAEALARGVPVLAAPQYESDLTEGPIFLPIGEWAEFVGRAARRKRWASAARPRPPTTDLGPRLGLPTRMTASSAVNGMTRRVLFVTANGVGLGHITRLSAIARRLPERLEPVFATMSQAASVLEQMGFPTELLTTYNGKSGKPWNNWTRERMRAILDYHQPSALVLDASNPYEGVVEAAACRPDLKLIWVRRGMWRATQDNSEFLSRAPYFDLIIEPDDIAAALDEARNRQAQDDALKVPPIGLLDEHELLGRLEARRALGLPDEAEAGSVLVQLGSGTTRDLNRLLAQVFEVLHCFPGLEIVLAQWLNTADEYSGRWRDVRLLTGFPIPRYYRAFDFTISAAGYNSFNDLLRFGVPTIFIANDAECMDDQGARARYAEAENAAFDIHEAHLETLFDCVQAILQPPVRAYLAERARALARPNGAAAAARAIARLLA